MAKKERSSEEYWTKEFKRGVLKLVILGILSKEKHYGYELVRLLKEKSDNRLATEEGTIYPLLHRLTNDGFLTSEKIKKENEREKKYYIIKPEGLEAYKRGLKIWRNISEGTNKLIDDILKEGIKKNE